MSMKVIISYLFYKAHLEASGASWGSKDQNKHPFGLQKW